MELRNFSPKSSSPRSSKYAINKLKKQAQEEKSDCKILFKEKIRRKFYCDVYIARNLLIHLPVTESL